MSSIPGLLTHLHPFIHFFVVACHTHYLTARLRTSNVQHCHLEAKITPVTLGFNA
ncbi:hypothetical protein SCP_1600190 [Sparassis crispa]|uniref:Uncharacterized protein n=1 Tax=Sparassis crispa TaxID=139825 RepID=A0A401H4K2_9APHY|nr:hypothetical protein SCP_1600190 [Sparassis crispa]GBE89358.1 hypothetical protein SCP_1600190 [Sparassis crispa]